MPSLKTYRFINNPQSERFDESTEEDADSFFFQASSTCVAQASYRSDEDSGLGFSGSGVLKIEFVSDGRIYEYMDFPLVEFESFRVSYSKGEFFNRNIRNNYAYQEV